MINQQQILTIMHRSAIALLSLLSVIASGAITERIARFMPGRNAYSAAGFIIGKNSEIGLFFWLVAFPTLACAIVFTIKWTMSRNSDLPYWFAGLGGYYCMFRYLFVLLSQ
jgi:hypothetical protein